MKRTLFILVLLLTLFSLSLDAQRAVFDSLRRAAEEAPTDSLRFAAYYDYAHRLGYRDSLVASKRMDTLASKAPPGDAPAYHGRVIYLRSQIQRHHGDMENAKKTISKAIKLIRKTPDSNRVADYLHAQARLYLPAGEFTTALGLAQQAFDLYRMTQNVGGQVNALNAMGLIQRKQGNNEGALAYYQKCYNLGKEHSHRKAFLSVISNLAIAYQNLDQYDQAIALYQEGLELSEQPPIHYRRRAYLQTNLGGLYQKQEQYEASIQELTKAYRYFIQQGSLLEKCASSWGLASSHFKLNQFQQSITYARESLALAGEQKQFRADAHELLASALKATNQPDSALVHLEKSYAINEELIKETNDKSVAELEARFQNREQKLEIDRLAAEDKNKARLLRQRSWIIGITLSGLVLLGALLWRNLRQRRQIETQNDIITQALNDKELLLKEIHHRVKNNLQMVSSLLNMQTHFIEDEAAADALQLGRSRVRSMALIHQKLYIGDTVSTLVDAKDYLERLAQEVVDTHTPPGTNIKLRLDIEPLEMDIDTVVPLGLLTNEAVTNAVKYAFDGQIEGALHISLWKREDQYTLTIKDNGPGLNRSTQPKSTDSFGQLLMRTLAEQLEGTLETKDTGDGLQLTVRF